MQSSGSAASRPAEALAPRGRDRPFLGILLMLGFCALAPVADSIAKILGGSVPLLQLLLARFVIQCVLLLPLTGLRGGAFRVPRSVRWLVMARTVLHIVGIGAMFTALRFMPLADAVAIAFVMPFILLWLGRLFLNEQVGQRRLLACLVGFVGTLLVIQPSFAQAGLPALLPLLVAVIFAFFMLLTRPIAMVMDPVGLQAVSGLIGSLILAFVYLATRGLELPGIELVRPTLVEAMLLMAIGIVGTAAHLLMTWSLRFAPSTTLAPMQYLEIPVATFFGWMIFSDLPNGLAAVGIVVTISAGLYIVLSERNNKG